MSHFPTTYWNLTRRLFEASLSIFYSQVPTCAAFGQKCNNWLGLSRDKFLSNFRTVMTSLLLLQKRWSVHRNYSSRWQIETHKNLQSHVSQKRNIHRTKSFKFSRIRAIEEEKAWNSAITATKNLWIYELFLQDSCFSLVIKPNFTRPKAKGVSDSECACSLTVVCLIPRGICNMATSRFRLYPTLFPHIPIQPSRDLFDFTLFFFFANERENWLSQGVDDGFERCVCCEIKFWWENPRFWIMTIVLRMNVWNWKGMEIVLSNYIIWVIIDQQRLNLIRDEDWREISTGLRQERRMLSWGTVVFLARIYLSTATYLKY